MNIFIIKKFRKINSSKFLLFIWWDSIFSWNRNNELKFCSGQPIVLLCPLIRPSETLRGNISANCHKNLTTLWGFVDYIYNVGKCQSKSGIFNNLAIQNTWDFEEVFKIRWICQEYYCNFRYLFPYIYLLKADVIA